jgi:hypothetical protein
MPDQHAFMIDRAEAARFGNYVRKAEPDLADTWDGTWTSSLWERFAGAAWSLATPPILQPPFVVFHPRVLSCRLEVNETTGRLDAAVDVITPQPRPLQYMSAETGGVWQDWPIRSASGPLEYQLPDYDDVAKRPFLLTRATLMFALTYPKYRFPPASKLLPGLNGDNLVATARGSVRVLVDELNKLVDPVIRRIEAA